MAQGEPLDVVVNFTIGSVSTDLNVLGFEAQEYIGQLFQLEVDLAVDAKKPVKFDQVVGKSAQLTLTGGGFTRYFHGVVSRFQLREKNRNWLMYQVTVVPKVWRLLHRKDSRIFQNKSMKTIVEELLKKAQIDHQLRAKGNQNPAKRENCVQYRESDWNFISRLLEEEGFFYFFEHQNQKHNLQISNDPSHHQDINKLSKTDTSSDKVTYTPGTPLTPGAEQVFSFRYEERIRSGAVALKDFNFLKPSVDYKKDKAQTEGLDKDLEVYDYPALYPFPSQEETDAGDSEEITTKEKQTAAMPEVRQQEIEAGRKVGMGASDSIRFCAGYTFTLDNWDLMELKDKSFLLTQVLHIGEKHTDLEGGAPSKKVRYYNRFMCIPKSVTFRPPRVTAKPVVQGSQTAIVTGPTGEEIYTDKHGRVKVQFHWDRLGENNEKSSCWVRVSQLWAGASWGAMWIPRIGHEVIVDFLEGDPDRPIIIGRVYHAQNVPPYTLPDDKTKSTIKSNSTIGGGGWNEICFEDKKGSEQFITHAEKDQNEKVKNNLSTSVGSNHSLSVGGKQDRTIKKDRTSTITEGNDKLTVVKGTQSITVKGDTSLTVQAGSRKVSVTGGNYTVDVSGGNIQGTASAAVVFHGKAGGVGIIGDAKGVGITGTGKGVGIEGTGEGVTISGTGGPGVSISGKGGTGVQIEGNPNVYAHGTTNIELKGDSGAALVGKTTIVDGSSTVDVQGPDIAVVGGTKVTIAVGGSTITVESSGITVNGGSSVKIIGGVVNIN